MLLFHAPSRQLARYVDRIADEWLAILVALTVGTWLTIVAAAWTLRIVLKLTGAEDFTEAPNALSGVRSRPGHPEQRRRVA